MPQVLKKGVRDRILVAALEVFAAAGYTATTMAAIGSSSFTMPGRTAEAARTASATTALDPCPAYVAAGFDDDGVDDDGVDDDGFDDVVEAGDGVEAGDDVDVVGRARRGATMGIEGSASL